MDCSASSVRRGPVGVSGDGRGQKPESRPRRLYFPAPRLACRFARRLHWTQSSFLGVLLLVFLAACVSGTAAAQQSASRAAVVLTLDGAVSPASADYLVRGIERAAEEGASVIVLQMDTPGGLDTSMREIVRAILSSPVPVLGFVAPGGARAASAGTYILYACHVAAMAPGTNLGAATPVAIGGGMPFGGGDEEGKRREPARGEWISGDIGHRMAGQEVGRAIGQAAGRISDPLRIGTTASTPKEAAKRSTSGQGATGPGSAAGEKRDKEPSSPSHEPSSAMEAKSINDAVAWIRSLAEMRGRNADWAEQAVREAASLSARQALAHNVIDLIATDINDLLAQVDGRSVTIAGQTAELHTQDLVLRSIEPDWRTRLLSVLANPSLALILMSIGFYGLIFEFMHPGALYPGTIGAICLLLGLYALSVLPVNYAGVGLVMLGLVLMIAEAFTPSAGIAAVTGAAAFVLGATILVDTDLPGFGVPWTSIITIVAASLAFSLLVLRMLWHARRRPALTGGHGMIGELATVLEWDNGRGRVLAAGERWQAEGPAALPPGQRVRVVGVDGLVLRVGTEHS